MELHKLGIGAAGTINKSTLMDTLKKIKAQV
jgi:hypothetical protein